MTKIVKKASVLLNLTDEPISTVKVKKVSTKVSTKKASRVSRRKTVEEKVSLAVSKMNPEALKPVKVTTADFLSFLANNLENGTGVNYGSPVGTVGVLPRKPQELASTIKYLKRQVNMLNK